MKNYILSFLATLFMGVPSSLPAPAATYFYSSISLPATTPAVNHSVSDMTATANAFANHQLIEVYQEEEKTFVILDDHSVWQVEPSCVNTLRTNPFLNLPVTLMPNTGPTEYPMLFLIEKVVFFAKLVVFPFYEKQVVDFDSQKGILTVVYMENPPLTLKVHPQHLEIVQKWQEGQRILECGIWHVSINSHYSNGTYPYTLYNYATEEFIFYEY